MNFAPNFCVIDKNDFWKHFEGKAIEYQTIMKLMVHYKLMFCISLNSKIPTMMMYLSKNK